jgi:cytochrome P450
MLGRMAVAHRPSAPPRLRLPATVQTALGLYWPEQYLVWVVRRYRERRVVGMRANFLGRFFTISDPDAVKDVFTADRHVACAGQANSEILGASVGASSVLCLDGDEHLRVRRLLLPPFHGEAVKRYAAVVDDVTAAEVATWPVGEEVETLERMRAITLEVILRAVVGVRDPERLARLRALLPRVLGTHPFAVVAEARYPRIGRTRLARRLPWIRAREEAVALLREEVRAHPTDGDDVLALLLSERDGVGLSDDEVTDQLLTLLIAGHETTAAALAWAFERLVRTPAALARLQDEVRTGDGEAYLSAVVDETLRLRPPLEAAWRRLARPAPVAGYTLPAGSLLSVSIRAAQRGEAFPAPREFRPERFVEGSAPPYTLIAFGGGTRRCLGASFAVMEMKRVLATVLSRVELRAPAGGRTAERQSRARFATVPARGGRVHVYRKL